MLWRTHIRIGYEVLRRLRISKTSIEARSLREGIITPDKWKDFPHHHSKGREISKHIIEARKLFLKDDLKKACFHLGVALHYIQDSYTSLTSRSKHHARWEEQMDQAYFNDNLTQLVKKAFHVGSGRFAEYQERAELLSHEIEGKEATLHIATLSEPARARREWGKPYVDVNFALRASYLVSKAVFARKNYLNLQRNLDFTHQVYEEKLQYTEILFANKIVELVGKRNEREKRKRKGGFLQSVRNLFLTLSSQMQGFKAKRKLSKYEKQKHLHEVLSKYEKAVKTLVAPHYLWYIYDIHQIKLSIVRKELLSISEVSEYLRIEESSARELVYQNKLPCYRLKGRELFKRSEIGQI